MKRFSTHLMVAVLACAGLNGCLSNPHAKTVTSINVVGYVAAMSPVEGIVTTMNHPGAFPTYAPQRMKCRLMGAQFTAEFGLSVGGKFVRYSWIRPEGAVDEVAIDGVPLTLLDNQLKDGCLVTKDYGSIPVGIHQYDDKTFLCMLVLSDNQLVTMKAALAKTAK